MFFDPVYMVILAVGAVLSFGAQAMVKSRFHKWSQVGLQRGFTGAEIAELILRTQGIRNVRVEPTQGFLSDHYDPTDKVLRLSPDVYSGRSVSAAGVAAHEVGHALQDQAGYWPMRMRQAMVPVASIGSNLGIILVVAGVAIGISGLSTIGILLFGAAVAFTVVTLPVEFDASYRAHQALTTGGIVTKAEAEGVRSVLTAAAATYLAAATTAILQLIYWIMVSRRE